MGKILVISDDDIMRMLYADVLGEEGYNVITQGAASDLAGSIEQNNPDLVIPDHNLTDHDTFDRLRHLLPDRHQNLPLILSTSFPSLCRVRSAANQACVFKSPHMDRLKARFGTMFPPSAPRPEPPPALA